jgi:hypothetical protein
MVDQPDWGRFTVDPGAIANQPLGDPTRWGTRVPTLLPATLTEKFSDQIVFAAARGPYSRSWAIVGNLKLPQATWNAPGIFPAGPFPLIVALDIVQGVGQTQIDQQIILMCGNNPNVGLCNTQNAINGGPYLSQFDTTPPFDEARSFSAIGALVGSTINIRARFIGGTNVGLPTTAQCEILLTPFAAGTGL